MVRKLIEWAVNAPFIVIVLALALVAVGSYAFQHINVEAYPDPAPAIIEVVAQYPGASAEEVERLVTIPLEIALAGMPGLQYTRSRPLPPPQPVRVRSRLLRRPPGGHQPPPVRQQPAYRR
jgi:cobalt-zinc-cadmium resistance protein CzcA